jgi:hypothetical protein
MAASQFAGMKPRTADELQEFASSLGEHTRKFSDDIQYKTFVQELVEVLMVGLKPDHLNEICKHVDLLETQRAKEEQSGNFTHGLPQGGGDDSDDGGADQGLYVNISTLIEIVDDSRCEVQSLKKFNDDAVFLWKPIDGSG